MCPGGQIVNSATNSSEVCVNGMSFSGRDSLFANSALVVTVSEGDEILRSYGEGDSDPLAGMLFQEDIERKAAILGGGNCSVPVQKVADFINGEESDQETLPKSSYQLGITAARLDNIYPPQITEALRSALVDYDRRMPGYICDEALLHGVETRSSSPLRIDRDPDTCESVNARGLYIAGEGGGFAGGIVSASVDGIKVAEAIEKVVAVM